MYALAEQQVVSYIKEGSPVGPVAVANPNICHNKELNVTGFAKTYHLHTRDTENNYMYFNKVELQF